MSYSFDKATDRGSIGDNVYTIFEHLKSLVNDFKHRHRWIWELMQNARFVTNISLQLRSKVERVRQISGLQNEVVSEVISDGIATSIKGTNIRYAIQAALGF